MEENDTAESIQVTQVDECHVKYPPGTPLGVLPLSVHDGLFLTIIEGANFGRSYQLERSEVIIGRSDEADIQIDDEKVSRKHLKLHLLKGVYYNFLANAIDLNSRNGVFINGIRVTEKELRHGDKIKVGDTILKFEQKDCYGNNFIDEIYRQTAIDLQTGVYNKSYFLNELKRFVEIASRYSRSFAVIRIDIDCFKNINSNYGFDVGDRVLVMVSDILRKHVGSNDITARFGGDQFVILLPEKNLNGAVVVAERIRMGVESDSFENAGCLQHITLSIGISEYLTSGLKGEEILKLAEDAVLRAKQNGRNRVCIG